LQSVSVDWPGQKLGLTYIRNAHTLAECGSRGAKRKRNLTDHGLDFVDVERVFNGPTFTFEDDRCRYDEQRFVTLGLFKGIAVSVVHTETKDRIQYHFFPKGDKT
jgi:uncharacterized protein